MPNTWSISKTIVQTMRQSISRWRFGWQSLLEVTTLTPGRGKGRFGEKTTKAPVRELKFAPLQARANTNKSAVATYATTKKDAVIQQVERTFRHGPDIGRRSLDAMKIIDLEPYRPIRNISPLSDEHDRQVDQGGLDIDYQGDSRLFKQRKQDL
jgi:hypothetical protein